MAANSGLAVGGRAQNNAAPFVGSNPHTNSLSSRPSSQNQTLGFMSNQTIPYHYTIQRWKGGLDKSIMNGQIVFLASNNDHPVKNARSFTMYNLPMLNYQLYRDAMNRMQAKAMFADSAEDEFADDVVLERILNTYKVVGSVINDVNGKYDHGNNSDRVINVCISGRHTT